MFWILYFIFGMIYFGYKWDGDYFGAELKFVLYVLLYPICILIDIGIALRKIL